MKNYRNVPEQFRDILEKDEQVLWMGTPAKVPFMLTGIPILIVGLIWFSFDFPFILAAFKAPSIMIFMVPFLLLHLLPFWGGLFTMVHLWMSHGNTYYAFTNKRLLIRNGVWGTDYKSMDYDSVQNVEVNVGPVENFYNVGSIRIFTGDITSKGRPMYNTFIAVEKPYEVFKQIKKVSLDVRTDYNYPNALRPEENLGYNTKYSPEIEALFRS